ncbi:hypothetical protein MRX96_025246 [Rhipicephalus microplus]
MNAERSQAFVVNGLKEGRIIRAHSCAAVRSYGAAPLFLHLPVAVFRLAGFPPNSHCPPTYSRKKNASVREHRAIVALILCYWQGTSLPAPQSKSSGPVSTLAKKV